jgi:hypothetical protein
MTTDPLAHFRWLQASEADAANPLGGIYCVSFFRGLEPAEVLRRFGPAGPPGREMSFAELDKQVFEFVQETGCGECGGHVAAIPAGEWCVAVELWGWNATIEKTLTRMSKGSEVVAVGRHDFAEDDFSYAVDGTLITSFAPITPSDRHGDDPDRLNDLMREIGLSPEEDDDDTWEARWEDMSSNGLARAFSLAARMTGVAFTAGLLQGPLLVGAIED